MITRVEAGDRVGYGEAATLHGAAWSDESQETIKPIIDGYLKKIVEGADSLDFLRISRLMDEKIKGNNFAKAAVEMAVLDVACKELNVPLYTLLGGKFRNSIPLSWTLANNELEADVNEGKEYARKGWRILKLKTGSLSLDDDMKRVRAVREAVGASLSIRVDANQGWNLNQTLGAIRTLEEAQIDFLEQPLPKWDLEGLREVSGRTTVPVMVDESLCNIHDAVSIIHRRAASVFGYKLTKVGGITNCKTIEALANAYRIANYVGCMIETSIGTGAYLQFAASMHRLEFGCELWGPLRLKDDLAKNGIAYRNGEIIIPDKPGIGVEVDDEKLYRLSKRK